MQYPKLPYQIYRRQTIGLMIFGISIICLHIAFHFYKKSTENLPFPEVQFITENQNILLTEFDPNELDIKQWKDLGFSNQQVKTILNYKNIVGGTFTSKEQLKKCYAISEEKYKTLDRYILLPEKNTQNYFEYKKKYSSNLSRGIKIKSSFNPNNLSLQDWINLGFSSKQSEIILKYKQILGGSFSSKQDLKKCFVINDEIFRKLNPYILLPENTPKTFYTEKNLAKDKIIYNYFNPNIYTKEDWIKIGFTEKQAIVIVNYRDRNLKGQFKTLEDIEKCFVISPEKFEELKPWIQLESIENNNTISLNKPKEITDYKKVELNQITFKQLTEFGFSEKESASIIGFRKKLGGFVYENQILETYEINKDLAHQLISQTSINTSNILKYTLLDAPEDWLKNHPYFRYYAQKIIYYRITYPDEKKIIKKSNIKDEDLAKMKLYLK